MHKAWDKMVSAYVDAGVIRENTYADVAILASPVKQVYFDGIPYLSKQPNYEHIQ